MSVRVVDPLSGVDGARTERQVDFLQNSASLITVLCSDFFGVDQQATVVNGNLSWSQIVLFDEFVSLSAQFLEYRVKSIKFDVYDINPNVVAVAAFSTFHSQFTAATQPVFTFNNVIDGPDSQFVAPGTGKISLTWASKSTLEKGFVATSPGTNPAPDYGGLRYSVAAGVASNTKYRVVVKAVVQFRGRV